MGAREAMLVVARLPVDLGEALTARYEVSNDPVSETARRARVIVTSGRVGVDPGLFDQLPTLGLIAIFGVGHDRINLDAAKRRGVAVTNTPDVLTDDVADMAVALVYAAARRIAVNDRSMRGGEWVGGAVFGTRLTGRRIGIVGLGRIGLAVAARLAPVAGAIAYSNRHPVPGCKYVFYASAVELARASDVLILTASSAAGARPIVTADVLDALGPDGLFVNVARGGAVDEAALVAALTQHRILGAGLDVFADELRVPFALLACDNVTLSPHQASATAASRQAMGDLVLANIAAFLAGAPLPTPVVM